MDDRRDGWSSRYTAKPSCVARWKGPTCAAFGLLFLSLLAIGIVTPGAPPLPKPEPGEGVEALSAEIIVQRDGSLLVTEKTRIDLRGTKERHGISRRLPTAYLNEDGQEALISYTGHEATLDTLASNSYPESIPVATHGDEKHFVVYRLGRHEVVLAPGAYDFLFRFTGHDP